MFATRESFPIPPPPPERLEPLPNASLAIPVGERFALGPPGPHRIIDIRSTQESPSASNDPIEAQDQSDMDRSAQTVHAPDGSKITVFSVPGLPGKAETVNEGPVSDIRLKRNPKTGVFDWMPDSRASERYDFNRDLEIERIMAASAKATQPNIEPEFPADNLSVIKDRGRHVFLSRKGPYAPPKVIEQPRLAPEAHAAAANAPERREMAEAATRPSLWRRLRKRVEGLASGPKIALAAGVAAVALAIPTANALSPDGTARTEAPIPVSPSPSNIPTAAGSEQKTGDIPAPTIADLQEKGIPLTATADVLPGRISSGKPKQI